MPRSRKKALDAEIEALYRQILADPDAMLHLKLGAARALDRHQNHDREAALAQEQNGGAPVEDPMLDLDIAEAERLAAGGDPVP